MKTYLCDVYYFKTITLEAESEDDADRRCRAHGEFYPDTEMEVSEIKIQQIEYDEEGKDGTKR
jgi:hypothetical protein